MKSVGVVALRFLSSESCAAETEWISTLITKRAPNFGTSNAKGIQHKKKDEHKAQAIHENMSKKRAA